MIFMIAHLSSLSLKLVAIRLTAYRRKDILILYHHQRNDARCLPEPQSEKNLREGV